MNDTEKYLCDKCHLYNIFLSLSFQIEPQVTHTVQEIRNDAKFRFAQSFANLVASGGLFMVCYFLWKTLNRKVEEHQAKKELDTSMTGAGAAVVKQESNEVTAGKHDTGKQDTSIFE